jgi:hypothetical protein
MHRPLLAALTALTLTGFGLSAHAQTRNAAPEASADTAQAQTNMIEELDPFDPRVEDVLEQYDQDYQRETGLSPFLQDTFNVDLFGEGGGGCYQFSCDVFAYVNKDEQKLYLYLNGRLEATWPVSTGVSGHGTPDFDRHPNGRIYQAYSSTSYPGGDYMGLGNMPYAVFIQGGFAIHGTPQGNWKRLGSRASHGCIRIHPDNAKYFNQLVRSAGVSNTWITVD